MTEVGQVAALLEITPFPQLTNSDVEILSASTAVAAAAHFVIAPTLSSSDPKTVDGLRQQILDLSKTSSRILIRISADPAIPRARPLADMILSDAIWAVHLELPEGVRIGIYSDEVIVSTDEIGVLAQEEPFTEIVTLSVSLQEAIKNLGLAVPKAVSPNVRAKRNAAVLRKGSLRYRGAFEPRVGKSHYQFHYTLLPSVHDALVSCIRTYLIEEEIEVVLFDQGTGGEWFTSCLLRSAQEAHVPALDARSLDGEYGELGPDERTAQAAAVSLIVHGRKACLAVPVCKTGGAILSRYHEIAADSEPNARIFSVYFDERQARGRAKAVAGVFRKASAVQGVDVDYLMNVPVNLLNASHWSVQAAHLVGEGAPPDGRREISSIGLLSLLQECEVAVEVNVPEGRLPVAAFPQLGTISDWDGQWLAEHLVRRVEDVLDVERSRLLFVVPDELELNGSEPLRNALEARIDTSVARLTRATIDGGEPPAEEMKGLRHAFEAWKAVALADESAVSLSTFRGMKQVLRSRLGAEVSAAAAILDLSSGDVDLGIPLVSLTSWAPQRYEWSRK
jgi:hypothetical protein